MSKKNESPKLFISYCWSNPSHEQWVLDFATELRESGVDAILDKWDLKEGHDAIAFMEKMVTDPEIEKVIIVSNSDYSKKADDRSGGVGTETQIISKEIYDNQSQDKFVAVVVEKTEDDKPFLPTYYKSRIYIDLCDAENYSDNYEKLLRWIFNKPLHIKPEIGKKPSFLEESDVIQLGTSARYKRTIDSIKSNKPYSTGSLKEYLEIISIELEKFRIIKNDEEFDELVVENILNFIPYRNEIISLFQTISQYSRDEDDYIEILHSFFESLLPYMEHPKNVNQWQEWDFDNFVFIIHELFLYLIAIFVKNKKFEWANVFLEQRYYLPGHSDYGKDVMVDFLSFRKHMRSLKHRNDRLNTRRLSIRADLLKERVTGTSIDFKDLMQADFIIFLRAELESNSDWGTWWPETLLYLGHFHSSFEIFARASSKKYFNRIKCLLGIEKKDDLDELLKSYQDGSRKLHRWESNLINPSVLIGYDQLATRP